MKKILTTLAIFALTYTYSPAVTFNIGLDEVYDASNNPVATSTLYWIVVDKDGGGTFSAPTAGQSNSIGAMGTDWIVAKGDFSGAATPGVLYDGPSWNIGTADSPNNAAFAIYWFPTLTTGTAIISAGNTYGTYSSTNATQFSSESAWNNGAVNGATYAINVFTQNNTGSLTSNPDPAGVADGLLKATQTVAVPEPSTWALLGFGLVGALVFGRRKLRA